ncbi:MAG: protein kinase, partial [Planctomycetes bacterium]|nr:protein kinase [Planctomycetota bacterium]
MSPDTPFQPLPTHIGRYRLEREIGRGGMGVVHLAVDERLGRRVAIKILVPELSARDDLRRRLEREAAAISQLEHPAIVPIYEIGEDEGRPFIVMRYVEGVSLSEWAGRKRHVEHGPGSGDVTLIGRSDSRATAAPTPDSAPITAETMAARVEELGPLLEIFEQLADALDHAHSLGIIHRDVKPGNVVIDAQDRPHLLDFGLAKIDGTETLSRSGGLLGTMPYMAPEQVTSNRGAVDGRTDIYALGVTLYECMVGRRPFAGETNEALMFQVGIRQPAPLRDFRPDLSRDVETVVLKCLEKDPARRYRRGSELAADLRALREHRAITARPVGRLGRLVRLAELHRSLAILATLALVTLIVLSTVLISDRIRRSRERALLDRYELHLHRAVELEAERDAVLLRLEAARERHAELEKTTPRHLAPQEPAKVALYESRAELARLERRAAEMTGEIDFEIQRSREADDPVGPGEAGIALYRRQFRRAAAAGDDASRQKYRLFLIESGAGEPDLLPGRLRVVTSPEGAYVTAYPARHLLDGTILPDVTAGRDLGLTPIESIELPPGLWTLAIRKAGLIELRCPVWIESNDFWGDASFQGGRFKDRDWTLRLLREGSYDTNRWCRVPRGPFQSSPEFYYGTTRQVDWRWEEDFLIARRETDYRDYLEFLDAAETRRRILEVYAEGCQPRMPGGEERRPGGFILVPRENAVSRPLIPLFSDGSLRLDQVDWFDENLPVSGLSAVDVRDYLVWLNASEPATRLPRAREWEKAARGVDGRIFPWGDAFDWAFTRGRYSLPEVQVGKLLPTHPGSFPLDVSPYGVQGLAGNVSEICADGPSRDEFGDLQW